MLYLKKFKPIKHGEYHVSDVVHIQVHDVVDLVHLSTVLIKNIILVFLLTFSLDNVPLGHSLQQQQCIIKFRVRKYEETVIFFWKKVI